MIVTSKVKAHEIHVGNTHIMFCGCAYCHINENGTVLVSMCVHEAMFDKNLAYIYREIRDER